MAHAVPRDLFGSNHVQFYINMRRINSQQNAQNVNKLFESHHGVSGKTSLASRFKSINLFEALGTIDSPRHGFMYGILHNM